MDFAIHERAANSGCNIRRHRRGKIPQEQVAGAIQVEAKGEDNRYIGGMKPRRLLKERYKRRSMVGEVTLPQQLLCLKVLVGHEQRRRCQNAVLSFTTDVRLSPRLSLSFDSGDSH